MRLNQEFHAIVGKDRVSLESIGRVEGLQLNIIRLTYLDDADLTWVRDRFAGDVQECKFQDAGELDTLGGIFQAVVDYCNARLAALPKAEDTE